jgi:sugar phosphate isomerase/epimerase
MKIGVQLWSVNQECLKDYPGTLRALAEAGFQGVEFAGNFGGLKAENVRQMLADYNLAGIGMHVAMDKLITDRHSVLDFAEKAGITSLTIPVVEPEYTDSMDGYQRLGGILNQMGSDCASCGIPLFYHNHHAEMKSFGDDNGLQLLLRFTEQKCVNLELDVGFLAKGGMDSAAFIREHFDRIGLLHLKDPSGLDHPPFTPLGQGILQTSSVIAAANDHNIPWGIVELGKSNVPGLKGVVAGLNYLRKIEESADNS